MSARVYFPDSSEFLWRYEFCEPPALPRRAGVPIDYLSLLDVLLHASSIALTLDHCQKKSAGSAGPSGGMGATEAESKTMSILFSRESRRFNAGVTAMVVWPLLLSLLNFYLDQSFDLKGVALELRALLHNGFAQPYREWASRSAADEEHPSAEHAGDSTPLGCTALVSDVASLGVELMAALVAVQQHAERLHRARRGCRRTPRPCPVVLPWLFSGTAASRSWQSGDADSAYDRACQTLPCVMALLRGVRYATRSDAGGGSCPAPHSSREEGMEIHWNRVLPRDGRRPITWGRAHDPAVPRAGPPPPVKRIRAVFEKELTTIASSRCGSRHGRANGASGAILSGQCRCQSRGVQGLPYAIQELILEYVAPRFLLTAQRVCLTWSRLMARSDHLCTMRTAVIAVSAAYERFFRKIWGVRCVVVSSLTTIHRLDLARRDVEGTMGGFRLHGALQCLEPERMRSESVARLVERVANAALHDAVGGGRCDDVVEARCAALRYVWQSVERESKSFACLFAPNGAEEPTRIPFRQYRPQMLARAMRFQYLFIQSVSGRMRDLLADLVLHRWGCSAALRQPPSPSSTEREEP